MCNQPGTKLERGEIVNVKNTPGHPLCNFQEMLNQATGQYLSKASVTHWIRSTLEELLWIFGSLFKCKCVLEEISAERVQSGGAVKLWWRLKCVGSCFPHFFFTLDFPLPAMWEMRDGVIARLLEETQSEPTECFQVTELLLSPLQAEELGATRQNDSSVIRWFWDWAQSSKQAWVSTGAGRVQVTKMITGGRKLVFKDVKESSLLSYSC